MNSGEICSSCFQWFCPKHICRDRWWIVQNAIMQTLTNPLFIYKYVLTFMHGLWCACVYQEKALLPNRMNSKHKNTGKKKTKKQFKCNYIHSVSIHIQWLHLKPAVTDFWVSRGQQTQAVNTTVTYYQLLSWYIKVCQAAEMHFWMTLKRYCGTSVSLFWQ